MLQLTATAWWSYLDCAHRTLASEACMAFKLRKCKCLRDGKRHGIIGSPQIVASALLHQQRGELLNDREVLQAEQECSVALVNIDSNLPLVFVSPLVVRNNKSFGLDIRMLLIRNVVHQPRYSDTLILNRNISGQFFHRPIYITVYSFKNCALQRSWRLIAADGACALFERFCLLSICLCGPFSGDRAYLGRLDI